MQRAEIVDQRWQRLDLPTDQHGRDALEGRVEHLQMRAVMRADEQDAVGTIPSLHVMRREVEDSI